MRKKTGIAIILVALTLSLTTTLALIPQNSHTPSWLLTQTTPLQQPTPKSITITWGNETLANNWTEYNQQVPSICCLPNGSFAVAWHGIGWATMSDDIYVRFFNSTGGNTSHDILVNDYTDETQQYSSVSCFSDGSFVVAWACYRIHGNADIYVRLFNSTGGNETDDILVNTNTTDEQKYPSVCCFPDDSGFVVAWQSNQTGDWDVYAKVFDSSGNAQTGDILVNNYTTEDQVMPSVCCLSDDTFMVVWQGEVLEAPYIDIYAKVFNSSTGESITADFLVNTYTPSTQAAPSVCCFPDGSFVVAWSGFGSGDNLGVYAKVFNSTYDNQTGDILVNNYTDSVQRNPSVCCFPDGSFVVAWESLNQTGDDTYDIYAKVFNSTGHEQTDDVLVNVNTSSNQHYTSVCCFSDGSFVIAWQSNQDDPQVDIYFRIGHIPLSTPGGAALLSLPLALLAAQSGTGVSVPLLVGGVLAVVVVVGVVAYWLRKR